MNKIRWILCPFIPRPCPAMPKMKEWPILGSSSNLWWANSELAELRSLCLRGCGLSDCWAIHDWQKKAKKRSAYALSYAWSQLGSERLVPKWSINEAAEIPLQRGLPLAKCGTFEVRHAPWLLERLERLLDAALRFPCGGLAISCGRTTDGHVARCHVAPHAPHV